MLVSIEYFYPDIVGPITHQFVKTNRFTSYFHWFVIESIKSKNKLIMHINQRLIKHCSLKMINRKNNNNRTLVMTMFENKQA